MGYKHMLVIDQQRPVPLLTAEQPAIVAGSTNTCLKAFVVQVRHKAAQVMLALWKIDADF